MKTLKEFNDERWAEYEAMWDQAKPHANGIACPECGKELWDSNPTIVLASNPPKANVHCPACDYRGVRIR